MEKVCKAALLATVVVCVAKPFVRVDLTYLLFAVAVITFVTAIPLQGPGFKKVTLAFLAAGAALHVYAQAPPALWLQSAVSTADIIAIIVVMQLFTLPIELGRYDETVAFWLERSVSRESTLFLFTSFVTHLLASFLLFGTVPVMVALFGRSLKGGIDEYERFLSSAIVRGYTLAVLWAPGAVIMLLVLQVTKVAWLDIFVPAVLLAMAGLATSYAVERLAYGHRPLARPAAAAPVPGGVRRQTAHILLVVFGLIGGIAVFEKTGLGAGAERILLAGLLVAGAWLSRFCGSAGLGRALRGYWERDVVKAVDLAAFFLAMGLFAGGVDHSGLLGVMQPYLQQVADWLGFGAVFVIPLAFVSLAIAGIHPFLLVIMIGKVLMSLSLPIPPVSLALVLLVASSVSFIASPFAGMVLTAAKFLDVKPLAIVRWNAVFCCLLLVEGMALAVAWG